MFIFLESSLVNNYVEAINFPESRGFQFQEWQSRSVPSRVATTAISIKEILSKTLKTVWRFSKQQSSELRKYKIIVWCIQTILDIKVDFRLILIFYLIQYALHKVSIIENNN